MCWRTDGNRKGKMRLKINGLYDRCFGLSEHKATILYSHLPFEDGFYVTENDIVLKVSKPKIYALTEKGWSPAQEYFKLWYDGVDHFADIAPQVAGELALREKPIK